MKTVRRFVLWTAIIFLCHAMTAYAGDSKIKAYDWTQFMGDERLPGVTYAKTPTSASQLKQMWSFCSDKEHISYDKTPGTPIIVNGYLYCYIDQYIRKIDIETGKELAKVQVYGESTNQFFIYLAYGDGKIFMPCESNSLNDKTGVTGCFIRAFDADTLKQLYVTESLSNSGMMETPIIYHDGCIVTGTYDTKSVYACFDTEDEDTGSDHEVKTARWMKKGSELGGSDKVTYGWNGAAFVGNCCYFGDNNGGVSVVNYKTGKVVDYMELSSGENKSTIVYCEDNGRIYVSHNADGQAAVDSYLLNDSGKINRSSKKVWLSGTNNGGTQSTPVIYNGRMYIAGGGYTLSSSEVFHVVDAQTMKEIYSVPVQTKGSAVIATGYANKSNHYQVYIYLVPYAPENDKSQLWIVKDCQGQTKADYEIAEGIGKKEYCCQSPIIAEDGSLIWYNDAAYLYCYGNSKASTFTGEEIAKKIDSYSDASLTCSAAELEQVLERYDSLSDSEKSKVTNIDKLTSLIKSLETVDIDALISAIDALAAKNITSKDASTVAALLVQYNKLSAADKAKVTNYEKLKKLQDKLDLMEIEDAVVQLITKIDKIPALKKLTVKSHTVLINGLYEELKLIPKDYRDLITNLSYLKKAKKKLQQIEKQLNTVDALIVKKLAGKTVTLNTYQSIQKINQASEGLAKEDLLTLNNYEYYLSPAKADLINLMIERKLSSVTVTSKNKSSLTKTIEKIEQLYEGVLDADRKYIKNYNIVSKVKKQIKNYKKSEETPQKETESKKSTGTTKSGESKKAAGTAEQSQKTTQTTQSSNNFQSSRTGRRQQVSQTTAQQTQSNQKGQESSKQAQEESSKQAESSAVAESEPSTEMAAESALNYEADVEGRTVYTNTAKEESPKDYSKQIVIGILAVVVIGTVSYWIWKRKKKRKQNEEKED